VTAPSLGGRIALVTGGGSGIGKATATRLAELGATVVVADIDQQTSSDVARALGQPHRSLHLDVSSPTSWQAGLAELSASFDGLDLVHLNAGICTRPKGIPADDDPLKWLTEKNYRRVMKVNADGVLLGVLASLPHLRRRGGGDIVVTASAAGITPVPFDPLYAMSKLACLGLVWSLGPVLETQRIRLNAICPGLVDTDLPPPHERARIAQGDADTPETIAANVVEILASARSGGAWVPDRARPGNVRLYEPPRMFG
jgi:NAD(P)-dependent dehydrogenase (short-subunit alcohol dehydrogenase family)